MVSKNCTLADETCQLVYISLIVPVSSNCMYDLAESLRQFADVDLSRIVKADYIAFSICWLHQYSDYLPPFGE
jgi:hypothetical protein